MISRLVTLVPSVVAPDLPPEPEGYSQPYGPVVVCLVIAVIGVVVFVALSLFRGWTRSPGGARTVFFLWLGGAAAMILGIIGGWILDTTAKNAADARQDAWWDEVYVPANAAYEQSFADTYGATVTYHPGFAWQDEFSGEAATVEFPDGHREDCTVDRVEDDGSWVDIYTCPTPLPLEETS
ncbi:hypothetical protein [Demequina sp. NBRC 110051]|uniref:hypothetical protein n=1 Tax=Demequina sp. NBRC 110051 TaxID=1570340 RepID=UPI000A0355E6|nr:hypothetical protein [Demequina sp. NBRC 110051]